MKLYAKPGFETFEQGLAGLWCPVATGRTDFSLLDCNYETSNHGTLNGFADLNTGWVGSPFGPVVQFNGVNHFIQAKSIVLSAPPALSASVWFRTTAVGGVGASKVIFGKYQTTPSAARSFFMRINDSPDNRLGVNISADGTLNAPVFKQWYSTQAINDGAWKHAVFTLQQNTLTVYIDGSVASGTFVLNGTVNNVFWDSVTPFLIGASNTTTSPNSFFPGQVAEACYWVRGLTLSEIRTLFDVKPGGAWQLYPRRPRSYFAQVLTTYRNRSSRYLCFPG